MDWIPVLKPHHVPQSHWSNKHPVDTLESLISPHLEKHDTSVYLTGSQITANCSDLIYVSSDNTVTVLLNVLDTGCVTRLDDTEISSSGGISSGISSGISGGITGGISGGITSGITGGISGGISSRISSGGERSELAEDTALLPNISDIQVFETQLCVSGVSVGVSNTVILHTMYHVILLKKLDGRYEKELLYESEEHVLSAVEGEDGNVYILTTSELSVKRVEEEVTPLIDVSDVWRVIPVERVLLLQYTQWFVVVESSAIHFVNENEHHVVSTIPTDYLQYTEKFLNIAVVGDEVIAVTSNYLIVYDVCVEETTPSLDMKLKLSHNVADAHSAQFYSQRGLETNPGSQTSSLRFSVFSDQKCSFFNFEDCPESDLVTFIIPHKCFHMKSLVTTVLDKSSYLNLTVDKRSNITRRINSGISGAFYSQSSDSHFILNKHKDIFSEYPLIDSLCGREKVWNSWLSNIGLEDEYWVDNHPAEMAYDMILKQGAAVIRTQSLEEKPRMRKPKRGQKRADLGADQILRADSEVEEVVDTVLLRPVSMSRDSLLESVEDKYVNFLLDAWDWS